MIPEKATGTQKKNGTTRPASMREEDGQLVHHQTRDSINPHRLIEMSSLRINRHHQVGVQPFLAREILS